MVCPYPSEIPPHITITSDNGPYYLNDVLTAVCEAGWKLDSGLAELEFTCLSDGSFNGTAPVCIGKFILHIKCKRQGEISRFPCECSMPKGIVGVSGVFVSSPFSHISHLNPFSYWIKTRLAWARYRINLYTVCK